MGNYSKALDAPHFRKHLFCEELVKLRLEAKDKTAAINEMADLLYCAERVDSCEKFFQDVMKRETQVPTSVGGGIAIPHARSEAVCETAIAVGKCSDILWDEEDQDLVNLIFLLAVPIHKPHDEYIKLLASFAKVLLDEKFREQISVAVGASEVVGILRDYCDRFAQITQ